MSAIPVKNGVRVHMQEYGYIIRADWYLIMGICIFKGPTYKPLEKIVLGDWDMQVVDTNRDCIMENTMAGYHLLVIPSVMVTFTTEMRDLVGAGRL